MVFCYHEVTKSSTRKGGASNIVRNILIIYPHWPPSNLTGVHRPRLVANYLSSYGWHPIVLTVHPDFYEERLDWDLCKAVSPDVEVIHVNAWKLQRPRVIGDVGLRSFFSLYRQALSILRERKIDFIWIPIPSFYVALLGPLLYRKARIPYGIDYIDPWIRNIQGRKSLRHVISNILAGILEPISIKRASLVTGISEDYYMSALRRTFRWDQIHTPGDLAVNSGRRVNHVAFPYGFDPNDNTLRPQHIAYPWDAVPGCKPMVYAGAFLPQARLFIQTLFKTVRSLVGDGQWDDNIHLYFLGTGHYEGKTIQEYAVDFEIGHLVHEIKERFSFLEILTCLRNSYAVMIIGSTEKHYSASKIFQCVTSGRPIVGVLHKASSAAVILEEVRADRYLVLWDESLSDDSFEEQFKGSLYLLMHRSQAWDPDCVLLTEKYSCRESARILGKSINYTLDVSNCT